MKTPFFLLGLTKWPNAVPTDWSLELLSIELGWKFLNPERLS